MPQHLICPHCSWRQEFSEVRPRFCSACGGALASAGAEAPTQLPNSPDAALPPTIDADAPTIAPVGVAAACTSVPEIIGGYRIVRRLGGGGMGAVYEAEEQATGRRVALKLVLPDLAASPETLERFRQEGRLASSLAHPRCVFVLAADEDQGRPYVVMELMQGKTLQDLVNEVGPLEPVRALHAILDVIEGLNEAHRRGMVHRDVKPSNCFLEADGRVKIGDFGLAKSLVGDSHLTRTGTFLGTPLYASPEQVKSEPVDAQSDVYSVAATLYFLLTGKAPFQSGDAVATLARIVSEDPPSLRILRPDLPKALDKAVLRGLQRDRKRRYRDLEELRRALVPFLPARPSVSGLGLRVAAYVIDSFLLMICVQCMNALLFLAMQLLASPLSPGVSLAVGQVLAFAMSVSYFGFLEGKFGCGLGKRLLRLRVSGLGGGEPAGVWRCALRKAVLLAALLPGRLGPPILMLTLLPDAGSTEAVRQPTEQEATLMASMGFVQLALIGLGVLAVVSTMRPRNGYRGLHEFASGTRTYALHWPLLRRRRRFDVPNFQPTLHPAVGIPEVVGPYRIQGVTYEGPAGQTLLAEDPQLGRSTWIIWRPVDAPPLPQYVRNAQRTTQPRWLGGGVIDNRQWDAFLAPQGIPLTALATPDRPLTWTELRPLLEDLVTELKIAASEGSLPEVLTIAQAWILPEGHILLLPLPMLGPGPAEAVVLRKQDAPEGEQRRALQYVLELASYALDGCPLRRDGSPGVSHAPVPVHAEEILARLRGEEPYLTIEDLNQDLENTHDRATEVTRRRRTDHLGLQLLLGCIPCLGPIMIPIILFASLVHVAKGNSPGPDVDGFIFLAPILAIYVMWPWLTRGGFAYFRGGIALRTADGQKPARWRCGLRALLLWGPFALLAYGSMLAATAWPHHPMIYVGLAILSLVYLAAHAGLAVWRPRQNWHDRLLGIHLVPD